ncbi:MAG: prepilin-type N-terminal cleavage/methylation domain-containing protein [Epsilonproteobacteria bacterium]|nr:prepilin-type N-terminal cleavage/methylation domain-containing protein [Campylobacterota bacterium]
MSRAFTLVELMVSIALTTIVVFFLYRALSNQEQANEIIAKNVHEISKKEKLYHLLFRDISKATSIQSEPLFNKSYSILLMRTSNSLHQIPNPYVAYFVHEKNLTLVRLESAYPIKFPVDYEKVKYIFADPLIAQTKKFVVLDSSAAGGSTQRELLPGERPRGEKKDKNATASKEYLIFFKWEKEKLLMDIRK